MKKVKEQGIKSSKILEIVKDLRNALPFAMVNTNPQNEIAKLMTYKSPADAAASGKNIVINDSNMDFSLSNKTWPNVTSTNIDASKVFIVDLDNIDHVWDYEEANKAIKKTSWYNELGPPPVHGFFIVNNAKTAIHWVDRESPTLQTYMTFTGGADNMFIFTGTEYCNDIFFKDFILYTAHTGGVRVGLIDFLKDEMTKYDETGGPAFYKGNISQRNSAKAFSPLYSSLAITNSTVNAISAYRDPQRVTDTYGRPLHYWAVATDGNASVYNPKDNAIYDSNISAVKDIFITENGRILYTNDTSDDYIRGSQNSIDALRADGFGEHSYSVTNVGAEWGLGFPSDPTGTSRVKGVSGSYKTGGPILIGGSNQGAFFIHSPVKTLGYYYRGAFIKMTSTYTSPYMLTGVSDGLVDSRIAAYPLNNTDDVSGRGYNLTNNNAVTFDNPSPFGYNCATFNRSSGSYLSLGTQLTPLSSGGSNQLTMSAYIKTSTDHASATDGDGGIITFWAQSGTSAYIILTLNSIVGNGTTNALRLATQGDAGGATYSNIIAGPALNDGKWHHVVGVISGVDNYQKIYVDGIEVGSVARDSQIYTNTDFRIGSAHITDPPPGDGVFDGQICNVSVYNQAWSELEIKAEYARMKAALGLGTSQTLASNNVVDVAVDPDSNYAVICAGDTAHLMDTRNGLIYHTETLTNLTCADLVTVQGSELPHMILGGSGSVKQVASDNYIGGIQ